jgi:transposase-like protein
MNNAVDQNSRDVKVRTDSMLGFKPFTAAATTIA